MMKKIYFILLILIVFIIGISVVGAQWYNSTDESLSYELNEGGCASIFLKVSENENVASFRRDQIKEADVNIENETWDNISVIRQYKTEGGDFTHAIIAENGWAIGGGGYNDGEVNNKILNISHKIISEGKVSDYALQIKDILKRYSYGHFVVMDPQGNYVAIFPNAIKEGKLEVGDYLYVPNYAHSLKNGTFDSNPVDSAIEIASGGRKGLDRRDIITYEFMSNTTDNGTFVNVYATNDDGHFIGEKDGNLYDNIKFKNKYVLGKNLPITPDKLYLGRYTFQKPGFDFSKWSSNLVKS